MPAKSKTANAAALVAAGIPQAAYTKAQWCARWTFSEGFYKKLQDLGLGPHETEILGRKIITAEDDAKFARDLQERQLQQQNAIQAIESG
jgi:hypothetical protein